MPDELASGNMTEDAIRPDGLMEESFRLHAIDLQWLLARRGEFVSVTCPACQADSPQPLWQKDDFSYVQCSNCQTAYLNPRPTPAMLDEYYRTAENYNFWYQHVFPASESTRRQQIAIPRVKRVLELCDRYNVIDGVLVEVGAGYGTFCAEAVHTGRFKRVIAVELTQSMAAACRKRGLEVVELPIEQVSFGDASADVMVSFEVIEHLFNPQEFLEGCARHLRPGGLLTLSCPNLKGFDVVTLGAVSQVVDPEHLNYFHPASLTLLIERCGFSAIELLTPGRLDAEIVRKRTMGGLFDLSGQPFLKQILLDEWDRLGPVFQTFLADNLLSSHMWIVARRK